MLTWPSRVCCSIPVATSQILAVPSRDVDASSFKSYKNATEVTEWPWPLSICRVASQFACTFGFVCTQDGISFSNCLRIILCSGAKIRDELYSWRGAYLITNRLYKANRFAL
jgi:hypothetical protein